MFEPHQESSPRYSWAPKTSDILQMIRNDFWLWVKTNELPFWGWCTTHLRLYFSGWIGMFTGLTDLDFEKPMAISVLEGNRFLPSHSDNSKRVFSLRLPPVDELPQPQGLGALLFARLVGNPAAGGAVGTTYDFHWLKFQDFCSFPRWLGRETNLLETYAHVFPGDE